MVARNKIFISHATPADNAFAVWLSSHLSLAGYEVWCDANKLLGGEDFWREIERTIRNETAKFLIVISGNAYSHDHTLRDGIAKELALADILKKQLQDPYFIVPIRLDGTSYGDFSIELVRTNGVDCSASWASGLSKILEIFERDRIAKVSNVAPSLAAWKSVYQYQTRAISHGQEVIQSNWLPLDHLPTTLYFYETRGVNWSLEPRVIASRSKLPTFHHGRLLASFAKLDEMQEAIGREFPIRDRANLPLANYLRGRTGDLLGVAPYDARNQVSSLIRQAWDLRMAQLGLRSYELANGQLAWWFPRHVPADGQLRFLDFNGKPRRRTSTGTKGHKVLPNGEQVPRNYWHLGFSAQPMIQDMVVRLQPRIIITDDGENPILNKTRMNGLRRSLTKMWFNDRWRGLMLGFVNFVAEGEDRICLHVAETNSIEMSSKLVEFSLPYGISSDPVSENLSDEVADVYDAEEQALRLSDPVFASLLGDEEFEDA